MLIIMLHRAIQEILDRAIEGNYRNDFLFAMLATCNQPSIPLLNSQAYEQSIKKQRPNANVIRDATDH